MRPSAPVIGAAAGVGMCGLAVARKGYRFLVHVRRVTVGHGDRLDHMEGRLDHMEGRLDHVEGRLDRAEQASREQYGALAANDADILATVDALTQRVAGLGDHTRRLEVLTARLDGTDGRVARLQVEAEAAGALAAVAVAAADEIETLGPSLRDLRRELIQLARQVQPNGQLAPSPRPSA